MAKKKFYWLDLEMTGLDDERDQILEVAMIVTDLQFNPLGKFERVVSHPETVLENMNDWCKKHHGASGLTQAVRESKTPLNQVEAELLQFLDQFASKDERLVLVGNSIGNDRRFIDRWMKAFSARLHYRMIDVSSFKEVFRDRFGVELKKNNEHRAIGDIQESIRELGHYLSYVKI